MSDQGFYQRSINTDGTAAQSFDVPGPTTVNDIGSTSTVIEVDTTGGVVLTQLPDALASAGSRVVVVNTTGTNVVRVGPAGTDTIDGGVGSVEVAAGVYASLTLVSLGAGGWAVV